MLLPAQASADRPRPNVLVVVTDDQPLDTEWAIPRTRGWLAGQGTEFTRGFATTPLCAPARASIFTGRYAHNHGVRSNDHSAALDHATTVQRQLREAGYRTGIYGKFLNGWKVRTKPPFFDEWGVLGRPTYTRGTWNINGAVHTIPAYTTEFITEQAIDFLRRRAGDRRPWLLYLTPYAPHAPNTPGASYATRRVPPWLGRPSAYETDRSDKPPYIQRASSTAADGERVRAAQLRTLLSVDDMVAAVRGELTRIGQLHNTLVFFLADNGYSWADHGWRRKSVPYGPAVRVPFYVSWPAAGLNAGRADDRLVAGIDIAPTILHAAGLRPATPMDGHSLLAGHRRGRMLTEFWRAGPPEQPASPKAGKKQTGEKSARQGKVRKAQRRPKLAPPTWASLVTANAQYTEYYDTHLDARGRVVGSGRVVFREYYDLVADPHQLQNLLHEAVAPQRPDLPLAELSRQLAKDRVSAGTAAVPVAGRPPAP